MSHSLKDSQQASYVPPGDAAAYVTLFILETITSPLSDTYHVLERMPTATITLRKIFGEMCFVVEDGVIGRADAELSGKALARMALADSDTHQHSVSKTRHMIDVLTIQLATVDDSRFHTWKPCWCATHLYCLHNPIAINHLQSRQISLRPVPPRLAFT